MFAGDIFYRCDAFNSFIKWKVGSDAFVVVNTTKEKPIVDVLSNADGPPCSWTSLYASRAGRDMLHAAFSKDYDHSDSSFHGPIVLKASSRIAAYPPLVIRQAGDGNQFGGYGFDLDKTEANNKKQNLDKVYLVPGTSLDVMLLGGPEKWDKSVDFIENVDILDENYAQAEVGVHAHQLSGGYRSLYRASCQIPGNFVILTFPIYLLDL